MLTLFADGVFVLHGIFVVLAFPSVALALSGFYNTRPVFWHVHILSMTVMVAGRLSFGRCPLVELEELLRVQAGQEMAYDGSFVEHVVHSVSGVWLPNGTVAALSASVVLLSVIAVLWHWRAIFRQDPESRPLPAAEASAV